MNTVFLRPRKGARPSGTAPANPRPPSSKHDARALKRRDITHRCARAEREPLVERRLAERGRRAREAAGKTQRACNRAKRFFYIAAPSPRRLTDSSRARLRHDTHLSDAAFCCATRIMYLDIEMGFGGVSCGG